MMTLAEQKGLDSLLPHTHSSITATADHAKGVLGGAQKTLLPIASSDLLLCIEYILTVQYLTRGLEIGGRTLVSWVLTTLGYLTDVHALLCCHEAQHREHHEACKEAGSTVDNSQYECIPAGKCKDKKGENEKENSY